MKTAIKKTTSYFIVGDETKTAYDCQCDALTEAKSGEVEYKTKMVTHYASDDYRIDWTTDLKRVLNYEKRLADALSRITERLNFLKDSFCVLGSEEDDLNKKIYRIGDIEKTTNNHHHERYGRQDTFDRVELRIPYRNTRTYGGVDYSFYRVEVPTRDDSTKTEFERAVAEPEVETFLAMLTPITDEEARRILTAQALARLNRMKEW